MTVHSRADGESAHAICQEVWVMLSDRERATFHEIQRQFSAENQSRQFSAENQGSVPSPEDRADQPTRLWRDPVQFPGPRTTLTWIMTTLCVLTFLAGSLGGALVFAAAVLVLLLWRHGDDVATPPC